MAKVAPEPMRDPATDHLLTPASCVSTVTHDRAFDRMIAAGAQPTTAIAFGCELMRNWAREEADLFRPIFNWYFHTKRELGLWGGGQVPSAG